MDQELYVPNDIFDDEEDKVLKPVDGGYTFRVVDEKVGNSKDGSHQINYTCRADGFEDGFAPVWNRVTWPNPADDPERAKNKRMFMKRFYYHLGVWDAIVEAGGKVPSLLDATFNANVSQREWPEGSGTFQSDLVIPRLPEGG